MTREQDDAVLAQAQEIERKRSEEYRAKAEATERRLNGEGEPFKDEDLVYSAGARCQCGAGMAYPADTSMNGAWHCSAWLKTRTGEHSASMPFAFWSVRSESQIARNNGLVTTRPEGAPWGAYMERSVELENERRRQWQPTSPQIDLATSPVVRPKPN